MHYVSDVLTYVVEQLYLPLCICMNHKISLTSKRNQILYILALKMTFQKPNTSLMNLRIDRVKFLWTVHGVAFCPLDNFLCVVQQKHTEENQTAI